MKNLIFTWLIFLLFSILIIGQNNFSQCYNMVQHNERAYYIFPKENEDFFIFGGGINELGPPPISLKHIYSVGNNAQLLSSIYLDFIGSEYAKNYVVHRDTFYYLGLNKNGIFPLKICLYKSNLQGDSLYFKDIYETTKDIIYPRRMCFDNEYIYTINREIYQANEKSYTTGRFIKYNYEGNLVKEQYYNELINVEDFPEVGFNHVNRFNDIDLINDSSLLISFQYNPGGSDLNGALYKTDLDGNVIWSKTFEPARSNIFTFPEALVLDDKTFVYKYVKDYRDTMIQLRPFKHPPVMYRMDENGEVLWEHVFETFPSWHWKSIREFIQANNGDIIGAGYLHRTDYIPQELTWIFRMNLEGQILWERFYIDDNYKGDNWITDVAETINGDLVLVGEMEDDVHGGWNDSSLSWLLKVDGDGCYYPGCSIDDTLQIIKANYYDTIPEFCTRGAKWTYGTVDCTYTGGCIYGYEEMTYVKDTIIDLKVCKIIERNYHTEEDIEELEKVIIYQDTNKIYQYFRESFHLLFDYGMDVGDAISVEMWKDWLGNESEGLYVLRLDSIQTILFNGELLKEYTCMILCYEDPQNPNPQELSEERIVKVMEKFGMINEYWLYNTFACISEQNISHKLRCYEDESFGFYQFEDINCDSILTDVVRAIPVQTLKVYPNPSTSIFYVELPEEMNGNLVVTNIHSSIMQSKNIKSGQERVTIDISHLPSGIYNIEFYPNKNKKRIFYSSQIVKQ